MSSSLPTVRARVCILAATILSTACGRARYVPPAVPANQLAMVTVDQRATLATVEGLPVTEYDTQKPPDRVLVAAGCRRVSVTYEATYLQLGKGGVFGKGSPADYLQRLDGAQLNTYTSDKPVVFHFPVKPGMTYLVTASFNGEDFFPRLVEFSPAGERTTAFQPGSPCTPGGTPSAK